MYSEAKNNQITIYDVFGVWPTNFVITRLSSLYFIKWMGSCNYIHNIRVSVLKSNFSYKIIYNQFANN